MKVVAFKESIPLSINAEHSSKSSHRITSCANRFTTASTLDMGDASKESWTANRGAGWRMYLEYGTDVTPMLSEIVAYHSPWSPWSVGIPKISPSPTRSFFPVAVRGKDLIQITQSGSAATRSSCVRRPNILKLSKLQRLQRRSFPFPVFPYWLVLLSEQLVASMMETNCFTSLLARCRKGNTVLNHRMLQINLFNLQRRKLFTSFVDHFLTSPR